jgi:acyl-CoA synthetase (AMP-forming)/AMP-acid ligase II
MLLERLHRIPGHRVLWVDDHDHRVSASDLLHFLACQRRLRSDVRARNVALLLSDELDVAAALCLLDGLAEQILIVSRSFSDAVLADFFAQARTDVLLTDAPEAVRDVSSNVRVVEFAGTAQASAAARRSNSAPRVDEALAEKARDTRWIIPTSGTTGTPKLVAHTLQSLTRSCKDDITRGNRYVWGLLYSLTRFAGLQVFLQSTWTGSRLVLTDHRASIASRVEALVANACNCLSATPSLWRRILMSPASTSLPLRQVTLGGEIADGQVLRALARTYPVARIVHIYASTEAGVGFAVRDGEPGFPKSFLSEPPDGVILHVSATGRLMLKPIDRSQRFMERDVALFDDAGFIDTGDLVRAEGERYVFLGRENGALNVGGHKVQPEEVAGVLLEHEAVALANVKARKSSMLGSIVEADVVLASGAQPSVQVRKQIQDFCRKRLEPFKVPAFVNFVDNIALSESGKLVCERPRETAGVGKGAGEG